MVVHFRGFGVAVGVGAVVGVSGALVACCIVEVSVFVEGVLLLPAFMMPPTITQNAMIQIITQIAP